MIDKLATFISEHQGTFTVIAMWLAKEVHAIWPQIVSVFPYCRDNGGVWGIIKEFVFGKPAAPVKPVSPVAPGT